MLSIYAKSETKVKFINDNGYDFEREEANQILGTDKIYTVKHINVGGWISYVHLKEIPNKSFNTVMFDEVEEIN